MDATRPGGRLLVGLLAASLAVACGGDDTADGDAGDASAGISIVDNAFDPDSLELGAGTSVTWTHDGEITHNVTADDDSFASENLSPGETFEHTFEETGSFDYVCTLHPGMEGTVEVS